MTQPAGQPRIPLSRLQLKHPLSLHVFEDYEQAQRAVDYLSDREFPVENVMIVGTDLKQVERVTGRLTSSRILASGAASGAWFGAFMGLLMWAFVEGGGGGIFLTAMLVGAIFGMIWALILYKLTGGARDFTSVMQVVATRYEVLVEAHLVGQARALLEDQRRGVPSDAGRQPQSQVGGPGQGGTFPAGTGLPGTPGAGAQPPYGPAGTPTPGFGPDPHAAAGTPAAGTAAAAGATAAPAPAAAPPRYRTYGEALDAERAARQQGAGAGPVAPAGGAGVQASREDVVPASREDDAAAEDAHDAPPPAADRRP